MGNGDMKSWPKSLASRLPANEKQRRPRRNPHRIVGRGSLRDTYDVDGIPVERMGKNDKDNSVQQRLVQLNGFPALSGTWEQVENLSRCEAFIVRFNKGRKANARPDLENRKIAKEEQEEERQKGRK